MATKNKMKKNMKKKSSGCHGNQKQNEKNMKKKSSPNNL